MVAMRRARSLRKFRVPVIDIAIKTNVRAQEKTVATIHCGVILAKKLFEARSRGKCAFRSKKCDAAPIRCGEQHPLTLHTAQHARREIYDIRKLSPDQFFGLFPLCDARNNGALSYFFAEIYRTLDELVGLRHELCSDNGADAYVEFRKIFVRNLGHATSLPFSVPLSP